jgi:nucleoid-associated protein YgaU
MVRLSLIADRALGLVVLTGLGLVGAGCEKPQAPAPRDNLLVLELGGDHPSLAADLQRTAPAEVPPAEADPATAEDPHGGATEPPADAARPKRPMADPPPLAKPAAPPPAKPAKPEFTVVRLADGQTLYNLCLVHLGNGARWPEVARLNGWSRSKAERLPAGQAVKLPLR